MDYVTIPQLDNASSFLGQCNWPSSHNDGLVDQLLFGESELPAVLKDSLDTHVSQVSI